jgi:hypothetical protein
LSTAVFITVPRRTERGGRCSLHNVENIEVQMLQVNGNPKTEKIIPE